jgi:hypothetical protein
MSGDNSDEDSRMMGVELGDLEEKLEDEEYPVGKQELLEKYGDETVELESGEETLRSILEPYGDAEFTGVSDVHQSILGMVDDEAVGERKQTDRGATSGAQETGTTGSEDEKESL